MTKDNVDKLIELEKLRHKNKMIEIEAETKGRKEIEDLKHDLQMQQQRIKSAEIKRVIDRKSDRGFMEANRY